MTKIKITGYLGVFESKLEKLYNKIRAEYAKPKNQRNRKNLKTFAHEAKKLKKLVNEMQDQNKNSHTCPKCGHEFER